jgi:hypothetical protein
MTPRFLFLAASLVALSGPALAADAAADGAPVSTASQTTDQKIAAWLNDSPPVGPTAPDNSRGEPLRDDQGANPDRRIHGEVGAGIGTGGYRSAYGVVNIPIGKSGSATVAVSTGHNDYPWVAGGPWGYYGPAGAGVRADCVCREAPDGSQQCRVAGAASRFDAQLAGTACEAPH